MLSLIGTARMERTLTQFHTSLSEAFKSDETGFRKEAHNLVNGAGIFGFGGMLELCRTFARTIESQSPTAHAKLVADGQAMRDATCAYISGELLPALQAANRLREAG